MVRERSSQRVREKNCESLVDERQSRERQVPRKAQPDIKRQSGWFDRRGSRSEENLLLKIPQKWPRMILAML